MLTPLHAPACGAINAAHDLALALTEALSPSDREKLNLFMTAGAPIAVTIKWLADRIELRVGITPDDSPPMTILALDFDRGTPAGVAH